MNKLCSSQIKLISCLRERSFRHKQGLFWAEGERAVKHIAGSQYARVLFYVLAEGFNPGFSIPAGAEICSCRERDASRIKATESFPGIAAVVQIPGPRQFCSDTVIALDGINDPGNLGTMLRTGLWFGFDEFLIDSGSADPYNEKAVRAGVGCVADMALCLSGDLASKLAEYKKRGFVILAADMDGKPARGIQTGKKILVFGNEANGISGKVLNICDQVVSVPGSKKFESLNVTAAAAIIMHEVFMRKNI